MIDISFTHIEDVTRKDTDSTRTLPWAKFVDVVSRSTGFEDKEASKKQAAIIGGVRVDETKGRKNNIEGRTIVTLDYDKFPAGTSIDDIEMALELTPGFLFTAYSTFRHTPEVPRMRVMIPLSREVSSGEYGEVVRHLVDLIGLEGIDRSCFSVSLAMFIASHSHGVEPWKMSGGEDVFEVDDIDLVGRVDDDWANTSAFEKDSAEKIMEGIAYLNNEIGYEEWLNVGMALHSWDIDEGLEIWEDWSKGAENYEEGATRAKWRSFGGGGVTMGTFWHMVGEVRGKVALSKFNDDLARCTTVKQVRDGPAAVARSSEMMWDVRDQMADDIYYRSREPGFDRHISRTDSKKMVVPSKKDVSDVPEWCKSHVYLSGKGYYDIRSYNDGVIDGRAFEAIHGQAALELGVASASAAWAMTVGPTNTVTRVVYDPTCSGGLVPSREVTDSESDLNFLNTYRKPRDYAEIITDEGREAIDAVYRHVMLVCNQDERLASIMISWIAHQVRTPGVKVRWCILVYSKQGIGKGIFAKLLQVLMGENNVGEVDPQEIIGGDGRFTSWAEGHAVKVLEELHISGQNRKAIAAVIKRPISDDRIRIQNKGQDTYTVKNVSNYIAFTNEKDAVPVDNGDRRYMFIFNEASTIEKLVQDTTGVRPSKYFNNLQTTFIKYRDEIGKWLMHEWVMHEDFEPNGRAPWSKYHADVVENEKSKRMGYEELTELIGAGTHPGVNEELVVLDHAKDAMMSLSMRNNDWGYLIGDVMGYEYRKRNIDLQDGDGMKTVYCKEHLSPDQIRECISKYTI